MTFTQNPYNVVFYEKTGCAGNEKQKTLLSRHGISFQIKSILDTKWTKEKLGEFFDGLEKEEIVNQFAPQIKSGKVDIQKVSKDELIDMMIAEPILIKRPLLEIGQNKVCGFDIEKINTYLNSQICESLKISVCQSSEPCKSA